jgi:hypothetical protein
MCKKEPPFHPIPAQVNLHGANVTVIDSLRGGGIAAQRDVEIEAKKKSPHGSFY